jgi:hypothetical protein
VAKAWISAALTTPLLFHALVFAALIHRDFMRWSRIYPDSPLALSHKLIAIQKLKEVISSGEEVSRDEVILAILILACQDIVNVTRKKELFNSPLQKGSWLNVYGNIQQIPAHLKAVMTLVALRGGLENLELKGLAQIITG